MDMVAIWDEVERLTGDPDLGLLAATCVPIGAYGALDPSRRRVHGYRLGDWKEQIAERPSDLALTSAVFGASHLDQGVTGWVQEAWSGLVLGLFYLACGRELAPVIVAHGTSNTLAFVLICLGWYPGLR